MGGGGYEWKEVRRMVWRTRGLGELGKMGELRRAEGAGGAEERLLLALVWSVFFWWFLLAIWHLSSGMAYRMGGIWPVREWGEMQISSFCFSWFFFFCLLHSPFSLRFLGGFFFFFFFFVPPSFSSFELR